jgi:hypothetical protein
VSLRKTLGEPNACKPKLSYDYAPAKVTEDAMALRRFVIERDIPKIGTFEREQLREAAAKSNEALDRLGPDIRWVESYVADDKTFCIYLAKDEAIIRKHAEISGFPALRTTDPRDADPRRVAPLSRGCGRRIDHLLHFSDLRGAPERPAAQRSRAAPQRRR